LARTGFLDEFGRVAHEHFLLSRRDQKARGLRTIKNRGGGRDPEFGFMPRVPLLTHAAERTEVDMKLGYVLFEAKLTERDFQIQDARIVQQYRDLKEVFECRKLPKQGGRYVEYQLLRNVLAAYALNLHFCVLLDARRPDLLEQ
jgi:hypothetical protein